MTSIKGQTIYLYQKIENGVDEFNAPVYIEVKSEVGNVLIEPASNEAITSEFQLYGKRIAYTLHIPKNDTHDWDDVVVEFYGQKYHTYGDMLIWDESLTPLDWNKKIKVERYE